VRKVLALVLVALVLTACRHETQPTATATPYPTYTPWPTYTPYPTSTAQPTDTPHPTPTPVPTDTPTWPRVQGWQEAQVLQVGDGDTIEVALNGQVYQVRYIGIDAPEADEPCYEEATRFNAYLVMHLGKTVYLEKDTSEVDKYGRLLRYVWIAGPDEYIMVNAELVAMGYAEVSIYPPDVKYESLFLEMEQQAHEAGLRSCRPTPTPPQPAPTKTGTSTPTQPTGCPQGCITPPPGCAIKGNISSKTGEKIYHLPGQRYYDQTTIDPSKGERWFCTEEEAIANGWRKSKV